MITFNTSLQKKRIINEESEESGESEESDKENEIVNI